jgi:hypothetical protein
MEDMEDIPFLTIHFAIILLTLQMRIGLIQICHARIAAFNAGMANFQAKAFI